MGLEAGWVALLLCVLAPSVLAQKEPHLGYAYPAGGSQGATFQVILGGQYLAGATEVVLSGEGIDATVQSYDRPMPQKRVNEIREKLQEVRTEMKKAREQGQFKSPAEGMQLFLKLSQERGMTMVELKQAMEYRQRQQDPKRQLNPQIAETVTLRVTAAPDAQPGLRELRLLTRTGLSNPLRFCIGQLPELCEPVQESELTWEDLLGTGNRNRSGDPSAMAVQKLTLPAVVNGQILPGEVDQYHFTARKGQRLVAVVSAQALIPYLADAVPGWFQSTLALHDSKGNEVAYADDFRFHPDPVLCYLIPRDGDYTLRIRDSIYRGREDFVYRMMLGELPFITGIFPLGGRAGEKTGIELTGWNLPTHKLTVQGPATGSGAVQVRVEKDGRQSNQRPFATGSLPEALEQEPNNLARQAPLVSLPIVINGRIDQAGDWDVFRFEGRAGQAITAEVFARRLDSPLDSILKLTDPSGRQLAVNDDHPDQAAGLTTHHADSRIETVLPSDGLYELSIGDAQSEGSDVHAYRLHIVPTVPDFQLRIVPASLAIRAGATVGAAVHVLRVGGFTNDIRLNLKSAPAGLSLINPVPERADEPLRVETEGVQRSATGCLEPRTRRSRSGCWSGNRAPGCACRGPDAGVPLSPFGALRAVERCGVGPCLSG